MAKLKLLIQGYAKKEGEMIRANSTSVLVEERDIKIVVDPGIVKKDIINALSKQGYSPADIQFVLLTHYHLDHSYAVSLFSNAKVIDCEYIYQDDKEQPHDGFIPQTEIAIVKTPGHTVEHCSLAVPTDRGMVLVAGDVFWWFEQETQKADIEKDDPFAQDQGELQMSREKIIKMADFVIPGHGRMFRVDKK